MSTPETKKEFRELLHYLNEEKGVTQVAISRATGIPVHKLRNIKAGRSSGDKEMLETLKEAYPDLSTGESNQASDFASREEELKAEVERLKKIVAEKEERIKKLIDIAYSNTKDK